MDFKVTSLDGKAVGKIAVSEDVFGLEPRPDILQRMVRYQQLKRQQGTHNAKKRSEITGSTAKIYRQKGTGKARHGSRKPGIFKGGGKAFGPTPRSHAVKLPKKVRALALKHALSAKAKSDAIMILDEAVSKAAKTKALLAKFANLGLTNALIVGGPEIDVNFSRAARNIPMIDVLPVQGINVYDILRRDMLVLTKAAVAALEERFK